VGKLLGAEGIQLGLALRKKAGVTSARSNAHMHAEHMLGGKQSQCTPPLCVEDIAVR
jgi:hypothetical protein